MRESGATDYVCEKATGPFEGATHHMVPRSNVQTCRYCGKSDKEIREAARG